MDRADLRQFLDRCVEELRRKNQALEFDYGIDAPGRWEHDFDSGLLKFSRPDGTVFAQAETTDIGSFSTNSRTWMWAWANASLSDEARNRAASLESFAEALGFGEPHFPCDEETAWSLAAAAVECFQAQGCYRAPSGHLWCFLSIDQIRGVD